MFPAFFGAVHRGVAETAFSRSIPSGFLHKLHIYFRKLSCMFPEMGLLALEAAVQCCWVPARSATGKRF